MKTKATALAPQHTAQVWKDEDTVAFWPNLEVWGYSSYLKTQQRNRAEYTLNCVKTMFSQKQVTHPEKPW